MYDIVIIGGGPGAITAGIYAARKKIKTLFLTRDWNGQVNWTNIVENYPGIDEIKGPELINKLKAHLKKYQSDNFDIRDEHEVKKIDWVSDREIKIHANGDVHEAKTLIISTGRHYRKLGVPGENEYIGKGISFCPACDAPLFADKDVAVIGGGNAGAETALDLIKYASKIYLLAPNGKLTCDECFFDQLDKEPKVEIILGSQVKEIKGEMLVNGLVYYDKNAKQDKELKVDGVFIEIGTEANSDFLQNVVELNKDNEIKINERNQTSKPNIFAAGDVTDVSHKQIIIAAGEGAKALLNAQDYLRRLAEK